MKILSLLSIILFSINASIAGGVNASDDDYRKTFLRISGGYGFRTGIGTNYQVHHNEDGTRTYTPLAGSYGKGFNLAVAGVHMFSDNVGLELGFSYLSGGRTEINHFFIDRQYNVYINQRRLIKANILRVSPAIFVCSGMNKDVNVYAKFGLVYGWATATWDLYEDYTWFNGAKGKGEYQWKITGGQGLGYTSSLGIIFNTPEPSLKFFAEINYIGQGVTFKKGTRTKSKINGQSNLNNLSTQYKEFVYADNETVDPCTDRNPNQDPNQPSRYAKFKSNFDSIGLNIGIVVKIGKHVKWIE
ncbi:MAG: hypothetical protein ACK40G_15765 [Cytophagaceae bacterium]